MKLKQKEFEEIKLHELTYVEGGILPALAATAGFLVGMYAASKVAEAIIDLSQKAYDYGYKLGSR